MFLEEEVIDGVLCYRLHPNDFFKPYTDWQLTARLLELRAALKMYEEKR